MEKQIVKNEQTNMTVGDMLQGEEDFRPEDLQAPQIVLMQNTSDLVKEGAAKAGDIMRGQELLADKSKRVDIVPLTYTKKWLISEHKGNVARGQFRGIHLMNSGANDAALPEKERASFNLPLEFSVDKIPHKRTKIVEAFCLLKQDLDDVVIPCVIWFKGGVYNRVGRAFMSHFAFAKANKVSPQYSFLSIGCHPRKNDLGDWFEFDLRKSANAKVDPKYYEIINNWYNLIKVNKVSVQSVSEPEVSTEVTDKSEF